MTLATEHVVTEGVVGADRLVIAPVTGKMRLLGDPSAPSAGDFVLEGEAVGLVETGQGHVAIRSSFSGWIKRVLALEGEPLVPGQPVVWIRTR